MNHAHLHVHFDIKDSFKYCSNCFCLKKSIPDKVHVNSDFQIEPFKAEKDNPQARKLSNKRFQQISIQKLQQAGLKKKRAKRMIQEIAGETFDRDSVVTKDRLVRVANAINQLVKDAD